MSVSLLSSRNARRRMRESLSYFLLFLGLLWFSFALVWLFLSSFKPFEDFAQMHQVVLPSSWHPENYVAAWKIVPFGLFFRNSFILAALNVLAVTLSSSVVAYGFARLQFWGRDTAFAVLLATMMLPVWVLLIPQFLIYRQLGWVNTWLPLIVPSLLGGGGSVFLMRQFFLTLPRELDEAAELDGCSKLGIYWRILMPLCKPVIATISIFTFLHVWEQFLIPLIYLHKQELFTVAIGLAFMRVAIIGEGSPEFTLPIQALLMAAGVFTSVPPIALFFMGQKLFVRGIALTGRTGM